MDQFLKELEGCPLFKDILPHDLKGLLACLEARSFTFQKGQTILSEGEAAGSVGVLLEGEAQVSRTDYYGNRSILSELGV